MRIKKTYKTFEISKKSYKKCETEIIDMRKYFLIDRRDLEVESDYDNWAQSFDKCDPKKTKIQIRINVRYKISTV